MQKRILNFLLLLTTTFISLFVAELVLRTLHKNFAIGTTSTRKAELYGWAMEPNSEMPFINPDSGEHSTFHTNSQGWKDVEHTFNKPEGTIRILVLGDSYTYGMVPLKELYTRQIERLLKQKGLGNVEVISVAAGGWGTDQELEALKQEGVRYAPDIVILQFCENDLDNNLIPSPDMKINELTKIYLKKPFRYEIRNGILTKNNLRVGANEEKSTAISVARNFLRQSALFHHGRVLWNKFGRRPDAEGAGPDQLTDGSKKKTGSQQALGTKPVAEKNKSGKESSNTAHWWLRFPLNPYSQGFKYQPDSGTPHPHPGWNLLEALLKEMKRVAETNDAQFIVFSESGDSGRRNWNLEWDLIQTDGNTDFIQWQGKKIPVDIQRPLKELEKICLRNNIPLIKPNRNYDRYHNDLHTNIEGNKRMAEDIVDYLISRQYLPAEQM